MRWKASPILYAVVAGLLAGCAAAGAGEPAGKTGTRALTEADSGGTVTLRVGDSIDLALEANATAGYRWVVRAQDEDLLATVETRFTPHSDMPGSAGTDFRRLRAKASGETRLVLVLCRPWECDASVARTFELSVRVAPANDCGCPSHE